MVFGHKTGNENRIELAMINEDARIGKGRLAKER